MNYKVGDKVRIRKDLEGGKSYDHCFCTNKMALHAGEVVTIKEVTPFDDGRFRVKERLKGCSCSWYWSESMVEDLVLDAEPEKPQSRPKFKVGDRVIGNAKANEPYSVTKEGWIGTVERLYTDGSGRIVVRGKDYFGNDDEGIYPVDPDCFDLLEESPEPDWTFNWDDFRPAEKPVPEQDELTAYYMDLF